MSSEVKNKYAFLRENLPVLVAEAASKGGYNPRAQMIIDLLADYDALEAERDALRQQLADSDAALRESRANDMAAMGHLADMRQQRDKLAQVLESVEREHDLIRRMKNCELHRGRGSFGIAVMSDTHAIEWQHLERELQQLIDARRTALAEVKP